MAANRSISRALAGDDARLETGGKSIGPIAPGSASLTARFGRAGAVVSDGTNETMSLRLAAVGREGSLRAVSPVLPVLRADHASYRHQGISEWYANGPSGLEQGFTLLRRPAGSAPLLVTVGTIPVALRGRLARGGASLALNDRSGRPVAHYDQLSAIDASGRRLAAQIVLAGREVRLRIEDHGAQYPLRVDPIVQVAQLTGKGAITGAPYGPLGTSIAVSANGNVVAVGAPADNIVYVFVKPAHGGWSNAKQTYGLGGPEFSGGLGTSVAVSANGKTIVTGDPQQDQGGGAIMVFTEPSKGWHSSTGLPKAELTASDPTGKFDELGGAIAIDASGDTIAAGAPGWTNQEGALYVFTKPSGGWRSVSASRAVSVGEPGANADFGGDFASAVGISGGGNTIVVGAPGQSGWEGAVYVFTRSHSSWDETRQLRDTASGTSDRYFDCSPSSGYGVGNPVLGESVAISTDATTIAAGETCAGTGGQVVVYTKPARGWSHGSVPSAGLTPLRPQGGRIQQLGASVALSSDGGRIVASDPAYPGSGGFVAVFSRPSRGWRHVNPPDPHNFGVLTAPTALAEGTGAAGLGDPLAISSGAGAIFVGGVGPTQAGVVYVYSDQPPAGTPTRVSCSPSTVPVGQTSQCTATVKSSSGGSHTPTGKISFSSTGGLAGHLSSAKCSLKAVSGHPGTAACGVRLTARQPLAYPITARYGGDSHHTAGKGTTVVNIPRYATATSVSCAPAGFPVTAGAACTAKVTGVSGHPPSVLVKATGGVLSPVMCSTGGATETCSFDFSSKSTGTYVISAQYLGTAQEAPSHAKTSVTVMSMTATAVTCSPSQFSTMQNSTCSATVTQIAGPAAPPEVVFSTQGGGPSFGPEGCLVSGSGSLVEVCSATLSSVRTGPYEVVGTFNGDSDATASTAQASIRVVNPDTTTVTCVLGVGMYVCTAVVKDTSSIPNLPSGTVTWISSGTGGTFPGGGQCTLTQSGSSASTASCTVDFTPTKPAYTVTANYNGDQGHNPTSGSTTT